MFHDLIVVEQLPVIAEETDRRSASEDVPSYASTRRIIKRNYSYENGGINDAGSENRGYDRTFG